MTQIKISDIKIIAKNLAQSLEKDFGFKISHSAALNLVSRTFGFANYNTYKSTSELPYEKNTNEATPLASKSLSQIEKEVSQKRIEKYPSIDNNFLKLGHTPEYDILIYEEDEAYFLLFRLKNNYTGRVFFIPRYESFSLFVYPDIKDAFNSYDIPIKDIETKNLTHKYFNISKHLLQTKKWIREDVSIMDDLFSLMEAVKKDREWFQEIFKKHSEEKLHNLWESKKNNIS